MNYNRRDLVRCIGVKNRRYTGVSGLLYASKGVKSMFVAIMRDAFRKIITGITVTMATMTTTIITLWTAKAGFAQTVTENNTVPNSFAMLI